MKSINIYIQNSRKIVIPLTVLVSVYVISVLLLISSPTSAVAKLICDDPIHGTNSCERSVDPIVRNDNGIQDPTMFVLVGVIIGAVVTFLIMTIWRKNVSSKQKKSSRK